MWLYNPTSKTGKQFKKLDKSLQQRLFPLLLAYIEYVKTQINISPSILNLLVSYLKKESIVYSSSSEKEELSLALIEIVSIYLDIYAYLRLLKVNPKPWLCIMVMGEKHSLNFSQFLLTITEQYTLQVSISDVVIEKNSITHHDLSSQCISFSSHHIDLNSLQQFYTGSIFVSSVVDNPSNSYSRDIYNLRRILFDSSYNNLIKTLLFKKEDFLSHLQRNVPKYKEKSEIIFKLCEFDSFEKELLWIKNLIINDIFDDNITFIPTCFILEAFMVHHFIKLDLLTWNRLITIVTPTIEWVNSMLQLKLHRNLIIKLLLTSSLKPSTITLNLILKSFENVPDEVNLIIKCMKEYNLNANIDYLYRAASLSKQLVPLLKGNEKYFKE
jgi:hypothetical protein